MPVSSWSTTASTNSTADAASGINWAESMAPGQVNDSARSMMAEIKKLYNTPDFGTGIVKGSAFQASNTGYIQFLDSTGATTNSSVITNDSSNILRFNTAGSTRMAIDTGGNVMVGKTSTSAGQAGLLMALTGSTGYLTITKGVSGARGIMDFYDRGTGVGGISISDTATSFLTSSDYRLKENVQDLTGSGDFIEAIRPVTYTWKTNGERAAGFIAHEFQTVSPTSVTGEKDGVRVIEEYDNEGNITGTRIVPVYQAMQASSPEVIANIVAELKSLRARVAALEAR